MKTLIKLLLLFDLGLHCMPRHVWLNICGKYINARLLSVDKYFLYFFADFCVFSSLIYCFEIIH